MVANYYVEGTHFWQGFYEQKILHVHNICFSQWALQCVISLGNLNGFCGSGSIISSGTGSGGIIIIISSSSSSAGSNGRAV
jgi:hypothetical protein